MNVFRIPLIDSIPGVTCVFTGRGLQSRPEPSSLVPLLGELRVPPRRLAILRQIHSNRCVIVKETDLPPGPGHFVAGEGDALITTDRDIVLGIATADCLPLVAIDPVARVLAVVHAGWRGTLAGVLESTLGIMRDTGAEPARVMIGAGPAAGACCYEVGPEVVAAFAATRPEHHAAFFTPTAEGRERLDLIEANRLQALSMGVPADQFAAVGVCTICQPELTHSFRRDGASAGRMWLLATLAS